MEQDSASTHSGQLFSLVHRAVAEMVQQQDVQQQEEVEQQDGLANSAQEQELGLKLEQDVEAEEQEYSALPPLDPEALHQA